MSQIAMVTRKRKRIADGYMTAKEAVIDEGFAPEIDWQDEIRLSRVTESDFLREAAWVVLSSGIRESVVRQRFPAISSAFYCWRSAHLIAGNLGVCTVRAFAEFRHRAKIGAIARIAELVNAHGFTSIKACVESEGIAYIRQLPFMGPATAYHFAKNIGLDVVKPDRHLLRVTAAAGYEHPADLCKDISASVGDRVSVIDLVIWRFATLRSDYTEYFA